MAHLQKEVIEPRLKGIRNGSICTDQDIFHLDVANYKVPSQVMEGYLSKEFLDRYEYSFHSFIFYSLQEVNYCFFLEIFKNRVFNHFGIPF